MIKTDKEPENLISSPEEFTTYYCPNCGEAFAKGLLISIKIICPHCNEFFVMAGLDGEADK